MIKALPKLPVPCRYRSLRHLERDGGYYAVVLRAVVFELRGGEVGLRREQVELRRDALAVADFGEAQRFAREAQRLRGGGEVFAVRLDLRPRRLDFGLDVELLLFERYLVLLAHGLRLHYGAARDVAVEYRYR